MLQIVSVFWRTIAAFSLTIAAASADERQIALPAVTIDLSGVAGVLYQQQAQLVLLCSLLGLGLAWLGYLVLSRRDPKAGAVPALGWAPLVWLLPVVVLMAGLALPLLRVLALGVKP